MRNPAQFPGRIFQAPIGSITCPALAAAVSNAGGVGHLACTWRKPELLEQDFLRMRTLTSRPYGANFVLDFPIEERLAVALEMRVPIISFFWGDGSLYLDRVKQAGALAVQVVGTLEEARCAATAGFDVIVAQGCEAGGHVRGSLPTLALTMQAVAIAGSIPVLAAGGISDRHDVAAALAAGAHGVWVGTAFLVAQEANIHPVYRDLVLQADRSECSELFDLGWPNAPMRTLANSTWRAWRAAGSPPSGARPGEGELVAARADGTPIPRYHFAAPVADTTGNIEAMALYAGAGVGLVSRVRPAADIVQSLAEGCA